MNILFLSSVDPSQATGGAEVSLECLAKALHERGHAVTLLTSTATGRDRSTKPITDHPGSRGVRVVRLPIRWAAKPLLERRHARRLARIVGKEIGDDRAWDVLHAHDLRAAQVLSELRHRHTVVTVRDYAQICGSPNNLSSSGEACGGCERLRNVIRNQAVVEAPWYRRPGRMWQYRYNIAYRAATFRSFQEHIYVSHNQRSIIARRQDLRNIRCHVIYNPVARPDAGDPPARPHVPQLVYVGTVQHYKGVGLLLEAFRELLSVSGEARLRVVGEGAARKDYEARVKRWGLHDRVSFAGHVPHGRISEVYDRASVVVAPHIWVEPFGRTIAEAMARGCIVVTADHGGPAELVQAGRTGFLFRSGSPEALRETLARALSLSEDERRTMSRAARAWVRHHLDPDLIARRHEEVYADLLSRGTS